MRLSLLLLAGCSFAVGAGAPAVVNPQLMQVHTVYMLPMAHGLDQFLANRLTREGLFQVVTDPKNADAVMTDRVGEVFEAKLKELYPEPKPVEEKAKPAKSEKDEAGKDDTAKPEPAKHDLQEMDRAPVSTFSRGKGTIFLVDRRTRSVIWSSFREPTNSRPETLNRAAEKIVNRLKRDLKPAGAAGGD